MVDRYQSLLGSQSGEGLTTQQRQKEHSILQKNEYQETIRSANLHAERMKRIVGEYQRTTQELQQNEKVSQFKQQQMMLRKDRNALRGEFKSMEVGMEGREQQLEENPKYLFLKKELLKATQMQMNLEMQLNQKICIKKQRVEELSKNIQTGSPKLQNALNDILQKREQIIYLEESIKECLQLFQQIAIFMEDNSQKLEVTLNNLQKANEDIDKAVKNIDKAKIQSQKCRNKSCCVIVLAVIIIILALVIFSVLNTFDLKTAQLIFIRLRHKCQL